MKYLRKFNESVLSKQQIIIKLVSIATELESFLKNSYGVNLSFSYGDSDTTNYTINETFNFLKKLNSDSLGYAGITFDGEIRSACYIALRLKKAYLNTHWLKSSYDVRPYTSSFDFANPGKTYLDLVIENRSKFENLPFVEIESNFKGLFSHMPTNMLREIKYYFFISDLEETIKDSIYDDFTLRTLNKDDIEFIEDIFLNLTDIDYDYELMDRDTRWIRNTRIILPFIKNSDKDIFKDVLYSLNSYFGGLITTITYQNIILDLPFISNPS